MAAQYTPPRRDQKGIAGTLSILGTTLRARSRVRSSNDAPSRGILTAETHQTVENQSKVTKPANNRLKLAARGRSAADARLRARRSLAGALGRRAASNLVGGDCARPN